MTLNISVVGKFHENTGDLCDKTDSVLYQMDEDDPSILPTDSPCKVYIFSGLRNILHIFYVFFASSFRICCILATVEYIKFKQFIGEKARKNARN